MPSMDVPVYGFIERLERHVLKPRLQMTHKGERKVEIVDIHYPSKRYDPFDSPGSTATVVSVAIGSRSTRGRSRYVRAWVYNWSGMTARNVRVFIDKISVGDRILDAERSPLHWTDLVDIYALSDLDKGYERGAYIDICASDSIDQRFQIISQKSTRGYHRFNESGVYRLELSAEAAKPCKAARMILQIHYESMKWQSLRVISVRESSPLPFISWHF
jgi:hypothetical protein